MFDNYYSTFRMAAMAKIHEVAELISERRELRSFGHVRRAIRISKRIDDVINSLRLKHFERKAFLERVANMARTKRSA